MPRMLRAGQHVSPRHAAQTGNYQQSVLEDKDGFVGRIEELPGLQIKVLREGEESQGSINGLCPH